MCTGAQCEEPIPRDHVKGLIYLCTPEISLGRTTAIDKPDINAQAPAGMCSDGGGCARLDVSSMDISVLVKSHDHSLEIWTTVCADTFSLSYRFFTDYSRSLTLTHVTMCLRKSKCLIIILKVTTYSRNHSDDSSGKRRSNRGFDSYLLMTFTSF